MPSLFLALDIKTAELEENHLSSPVPGKDTEIDSSNGNELQHSDETIAGNAPSESDADMNWPTPSDPCPVNLYKSDDAQEVSGEASCVGLVLDKTAETNENLNPVSFYTVTCAENSDLNRQSALEVETEISPAEGSKVEICEEGVKIAISAPNNTEDLQEKESAVTCSFPEDTTERNQPILDSDNHEGIDEGNLQLNNASCCEAGCEVPLILECGSEAKVVEVNVEIVNIDTGVSIKDTADETVENRTPTMQVNDSDGDLQTVVTIEVASSNGVH